MKYFFLFFILISTINSNGQIKKPNKSNPDKTLHTNNFIDANGFVFHPKFKNLYIHEGSNIIPFRVTKYSIEYRTYIWHSPYGQHFDRVQDMAKIEDETTPIYTISITGVYFIDGKEESSGAYLKYTNKETFLTFKDLLENYDKKGKLILIKNLSSPSGIDRNGDGKKMVLERSDIIRFIPEGF